MRKRVNTHERGITSADDPSRPAEKGAMMDRFYVEPRGYHTPWRTHPRNISRWRVALIYFKAYHFRRHHDRWLRFRNGEPRWIIIDRKHGYEASPKRYVHEGDALYEVDVLNDLPPERLQRYGYGLYRSSTTPLS